MILGGILREIYTLIHTLISTLINAAAVASETKSAEITSHISKWNPVTAREGMRFSKTFLKEFQKQSLEEERAERTLGGISKGNPSNPWENVWRSLQRNCWSNSRMIFLKKCPRRFSRGVFEGEAAWNLD